MLRKELHQIRIRCAQLHGLKTLEEDSVTGVFLKLVKALKNVGVSAEKMKLILRLDALG